MRITETTIELDFIELHRAEWPAATAEALAGIDWQETDALTACDDGFAASRRDGSLARYASGATVNLIRADVENSVGYAAAKRARTELAIRNFCDRMLAGGFECVIEGHSYTLPTHDMTVWYELALLAMLRTTDIDEVSIRIPTADDFIEALPSDVIAAIKSLLEWRQNVCTSAAELLDTRPTPPDWRDTRHWPANGAAGVAS